jgi:hypothetical protein
MVVAVASLLVLPFAVRAFWASAVVGREWTSTSTLIFLAGMVGGLPTALSNLIAPRPETFDPFGNVSVGLTGWAAQLQVFVIAASLAAALLFFVRRAGREPVTGGPWIASVLVVVVASADIVNGHVADLGLRPVVLLALLLATSVAQPGKPAFLGAAATGLIYVFLGALQATIHPTDAFRACRSDKCGPGGALYVGALSNENGLGLVLALTIPFMWLALRGRGRIAVIGYVAATVALTGSRTGQIAAAAALLALIILRPNTAENASAVPVRQTTSILAVVGVAMVGAVLPLIAWMGAGDFGDRVGFWRLAFDGISESPLLGHGGTAWPRLYEIGQIPIAGSYSPHNQWLDVAYASGFLGLALFVGLLGHLILRTSYPVSTSAAILIPVLAMSGLERPWSFAINDSTTFTLLAALLCATNPVRPNDHLAAGVPLGAESRRPDG